MADSERQLQDEYLEWSVASSSLRHGDTLPPVRSRFMLPRSVQRNNEGKITKLVFCNEGPEVRVYVRSGLSSPGLNRCHDSTLNSSERSSRIPC